MTEKKEKESKKEKQIFPGKSGTEKIKDVPDVEPLPDLGGAGFLTAEEALKTDQERLAEAKRKAKDQPRVVPKSISTGDLHPVTLKFDQRLKDKNEQKAKQEKG